MNKFSKILSAAALTLAGAASLSAAPLAPQPLESLLGLRQTPQGQFAQAAPVAQQQAPRCYALASGASAPVINASVIYPDNVQGMWSYSPSEWNPVKLANGIVATGGGFAASGYYYITRYLEAMGFEEIKTINYNISDWSEYDSYTGKINYVATTLAYSDILDVVYGCFVNEERTGYNLCEWNYSYFQPKRTVAALERPWAGCAFSADGTLYAIERNGDLYTVDLKTGAMTLVGSTGIESVYTADATIDTATDIMYWCVNTDSNNALYQVDIKNATATKLYDLLNEEQLSGMYVVAPEKTYDPASPAAISSTPSLSFSGSKLTGNIAFYTPRLAYDGSVLDTAADLDYTIRANGKTIATGQAKPNTRTTVPVTLEEAGAYYFTVTTSNAAGESAPKGTHKFVGPDTPKAPTSFTASIKDNTVTLNWNWPSSTGVNGGNVNYSESKFTVVRYPDMKTVCEDVNTRTVTDELPVCDVRTDFHYVLSTDVEGLKAPDAKSPVISMGPVTPEHEFTFNTATDIAGWTIVDANADDYMWKVYAYNKVLQLSASKGYDDWAITPGIKVRAGTSYPVSFEISTNNYYDEQFELRWGTEPTVEAMTNVILEPQTLKSTTKTTFSGELNATANGTVYIGLHATTETRSSTINLYSLKIEDGTTAAGPAAVSDLAVASPADGSRKATISFTLPTVTIDGQALEGDLAITSVNIYRDSELLTTVTGKNAGEAVEYTDETETLTLGNHVYGVSASNAAGEGPVSEAQVLVGPRKPVAPASATMIEEGNTGRVTISWEAVTTDVEGNTFAPGCVTYKVIDRAYNVVAEGVEETSVTIDAIEEGTQAFCQFGVYAVTVGGESDKMAATAYKPLGTPYATPWKESFANKTVNSIFGYNYIKGNEPWQFVSAQSDWGILPQDDDNGFAYFEAYGDLTALVTGKIDLAGTDSPAFTYYTYNYAGSSNDYPNSLTLEVDNGDGNGFVAVQKNVVSQTGAENEWNKVVVPLDEYDGQTVTFRIVPGDLKLAFYTLDNLAVSSYVDYNLTASRIQAPSVVDINKPFEIEVTVTNTGENEIRSYDVELFHGDDFIAVAQGPAIKPSEAKVTTFEHTLEIHHGEYAEYHAVVVSDMDHNDRDNTTETVSVGILGSTTPVPASLTASSTGGTVTLNWQHVDLTTAAGEPFTETFEGAQAWGNSVDGWKFIDVDKIPVGGINMISFPCTGLQSWFVVNNQLQGIQEGTDPSRWNAVSGNQFIASEYVQRSNTSYQSDDWAITPRVHTGSHALSFMAKSFDPAYLETFEVLVSAGTTNTDDFVSLGKVVDVPNAWTKYRFKLPDGTKYAAIRSRSYDKYFLFIDDVTYIPYDAEPAALDHKGYHVYRDNVRLTSAPVADATFTDETAQPGRMYNYFVTAMYDKGESRPSNTVTSMLSGLDAIDGNAVRITATEGAIEIYGLAEGTATVYSTDGRTIATAEAAPRIRIPLAGGIYIVHAASVTAKTIVK